MMPRIVRLRSPVLVSSDDQLVGDGRGDQQFLAVGRLDQVMRLAAERQALGLHAQATAQDAVGSLLRIEDDDLIRARSRARTKNQRQLPQ
jgi:hypothetical protein